MQKRLCGASHVPANVPRRRLRVAGSVRLSDRSSTAMYTMQQNLWLTAVVMLAASLATQTSLLAAAADSIPKCLYGTFTQGDEKTPIAPCGADVKGIGMDPNVLAVMQTFNIPTNVVVFQACPGGRFSVMPDSTDSKRFLVRYPSTARGNYLAPIVHELAHVVQMRNAGGLDALNPRENSRRIELGADFLAGLAFKESLKHLNGVDFETNLQLAGSYNVEINDHGLPEHRTQAFRRGWIRKAPFQELTILESMTYWNNNEYARIRR